MASGKKRASPGAEDEKSPLQGVALGDEDAQKLQAIQKDVTRAELALERHAQQTLVSVYEKRRAVIKSIPKFWPIALMNNSIFAFLAQHSTDQLALSYLEDVWVERDAKEPRCFTIQFYFKENPYFSDSVLKKEFKYVPPPAAADEQPDANGITESMLDFSWERDVEPTAIKINWKEDSKNLTKMYPCKAEDDDPEDISDPGSFFNFFEAKQDPSEIGLAISNEIFPEAVDYFLGNAGGDELDSDDEDDSDDDADEIDLEKPRLKKQKKA